MALRVLLADESSTIKKVFQLALQDFAVDVRPVNIGTDVEHVARDFQPDLIFADVLLQKRSGYEVASDLKQSPDLRDIPVILMFSGFMDIDEDKFQASHANAQLEKPFEVAALRKLVTDLVPRTQSQRLSQFLSFPKMPEMEDPPAAAPPAPRDEHAREEFEQVSIPNLRQSEKYRVDLGPDELDTQNVPVDFAPPEEAVDVEPMLTRAPVAPPEVPADDVDDNFSFGETTQARTVGQPRAAGEIELEPFADDADFRNLMKAPAPSPAEPPRREAAPAPRATAPSSTRAQSPPSAQASPRATAASHAAPAASPAPVVPSLDAAAIEKIVREQAAQAIEAAVWKIVPDLAAQIIERELNKLLRDREASPR